MTSERILRSQDLKVMLVRYNLCPLWLKCAYRQTDFHMGRHEFIVRNYYLHPLKLVTPPPQIIVIWALDNLARLLGLKFGQLLVGRTLTFQELSILSYTEHII